MLDSRTEKTKERLQQLSDRIDKLDIRFEEEKALILKTIDERGEELRRMLEKFKEVLITSHFIFRSDDIT